MSKIDLSVIEIAQYLEPFATAKARVKDASTDDVLQPIDYGQDNLVTRNVTESVNLMRETYKRMKTLLGNLKTMQEYSAEITDSSSAHDRDNNKALIRNLARGIDLLIEQTAFSVTKDDEAQRVLDGSPILLASGMGQAARELEMENLYTSTEGLGLSDYEVSGQITTYYSGGTTQLNSNSNVKGLDIVSAKYITPENEELEDGTYRIKVDYAGENSKVHITDTALHPIATVDVDLTGDGEETVDFQNGVTLTIAKTTSLNFEPGIDKYDYEEYGPGHLYADLDYKRYFKHDILADANSKTVKQSTISHSTEIDDGVDQLRISATRFDTENMDSELLADGEYTARLKYLGENSYIMLYDNSNKLVTIKDSIDLSGSGTKDVEFDNGLVLTVDRSDLGYGLKMVEASVTIEEIDSYNKYVPDLKSSTTVSNDDGEINVDGFTDGSLGIGEEVLASGDYTLEIDFFGANSLAKIKDSDGETVSLKTNVDLSADGLTEVDMGSGVKFVFNNDGFGTSDNGAIESSFKMIKASQQESVIQDIEATAKLVRSDILSDNLGGDLEITSFDAVYVSSEETELEKGRYTVEVSAYSHGRSSVIIMKDAEGKRVGMLGGIDLSAPGSTTVEMPNGINFVVENDAFNKSSGKFTATFDYKPKISGFSATFDFESYAAQIEEAITVVEDQMTIVDDAFYELNQYKVYEDALKRSGATGGSYNSGMGVISLLSSSIDSNSMGFFRPSIDAQLHNNIQMILATAGTDQQPTFNAASLISSAANQSSNSVFSLLGGF